MTAIRVKGFKIFRDKKPPFKWRCYHRRTGLVVDLVKAPIGSAEFFAECQRIASLQAAAAPPKPGTLGQLISRYRASAAFSEDELAPGPAAITGAYSTI
jgi:hypothetical protein